MCGRFTLKTPVANWLAELFPDWQTSGDSSAVDELSPEVTRARFNITPSQSILIVHANQHGQLQLEAVRWGLVPAWADSLSVSYKMINARAETLTEKPSFKSLLIDKRCVILADGYYEWDRTSAKVAEPYWIHRPDERVFAMAALWTENRKIKLPEAPNATDGRTAVSSGLKSATVITTPANADTDKVHDRMPVIFHDPPSIQQWLDPALNDKSMTDRVTQQLHSGVVGQLEIRHVSKEVNVAKNEYPSLILPVKEA